MADSPHQSTSTNGRVTLAVLATKLDYLIAQVNELCELGKERDTRIDKLERQAQITAWFGGAGGAVLVAVAIAAIKQWLGL